MATAGYMGPDTHPVRTVELATGALTLRVDEADARWPLDSLCAFATRDNPRRAFLIVSKLLGRHIPARPAAMRASFRALAAHIPRDLPGPILVVGLAETAICLGQGVHEELLELRGDVLFLHSTRQQLDHPLLCRFEEPHSHASAHLLYRPGPELGALADIRSLVLVDDEISTGTTLLNLAAALVGEMPKIEAIVAASLTDWSRGSCWFDRMPRPARSVSLLAGSLHWEGRGVTPSATPDSAFARAAPSLGRMRAHRNFGRLGCAGIADRCDALADTLQLGGAALRVVGTGEFTYPPFRLAERLEAAGHDVVVQATSRSPVHLGGPIETRLRFDDNYGTGVPNFLYNADARDGRATILCHETPPGSVDPFLVDALGARLLYFGHAS